MSLGKARDRTKHYAGNFIQVLSYFRKMKETEKVMMVTHWGVRASEGKPDSRVKAS